ncbi:MAG: guanine deaminase [Deltaproteobacteria bacterium]|nr:guanine deaminase [Deltaproteobacteria bacterium]
MRERLFRARWLHPLSRTRIAGCADGGILVDAAGRVLAAGAFSTVRRAAPRAVVVNYAGRLIIPGLVDTHVHLPQLDQRGKPSQTLMTWLRDHVFPVEATFANLHVAEAVGRRFFQQLIRHGTTTAMVHATIHVPATALAFELAAAAGLRVIMGKVMMDQQTPRRLQEVTHRTLRDSEWLCAEWHGRYGGRLQYAFTPRFAPMCSETLWRETGRLVAQSGAYVQTHLAETPEENRWMSRSFPACRDYVHLFERTETLRPRAVFAHAIHLAPGAYRRMAKAGAAIAHCPLANVFLKSGRMPIEWLEAVKIRYGLGTDVGAGPSLSMFAVMRHADYLQPTRRISPRHALYQATLGGARALRMEREIGNFAVGKWADFVVIDPHGIDATYDLSTFTDDDLLGLLMYRGDQHVVEATYVAGHRLATDGF